MTWRQCDWWSHRVATLFDDFATFLDTIPDVVRGELAFFLVTLTDESSTDPDEELSYERAGERLIGGDRPPLSRSQ
jgi:hypothetical protein